MQSEARKAHQRSFLFGMPVAVVALAASASTTLTLPELNEFRDRREAVATVHGVDERGDAIRETGTDRIGHVTCRVVDGLDLVEG